MQLQWSHAQKVRLLERFWADGYVNCPNDGADLQIHKIEALGSPKTEVLGHCPHCGRSFSSSAIEKHVDPSSFEGRFEIIRQLGQGGMGRVDLVRERSTRQEFAAKRIRPEFLRNVEIVRRFKREERIARCLDHPHLVRLMEAFLDEEGGVLVMDLMPGGTLTAAIRAPSVSHETLVRHFEELASALEYLHAKGVVHRDLKPDNVLIDSSGHARISDFGLAMLLDRDSTTLTNTGIGLGTRLYAAPEQVAAAATVTKACDIYALGLMAYEVARRQSPYEFPIDREGLPVALSQAIGLALKRNPAERSISPSELAKAFRG